MLVAERNFQVINLLAVALKPEMSRLDDAGVNRADGHLKNALPFDGPELVALALKRR